jgi:hypothetical protein
MSKIFEGDSDSDADIKTDNDYAKNYDNWRKKEELNKCKYIKCGPTGRVSFYFSENKIWRRIVR